MTSKELDERIEDILESRTLGQYTTDSEGNIVPVQWHNSPAIAQYRDEFKQLIRDCIEAVTPEKRYAKNRPVELDMGFNSAIDTIQANTKELLG